MEQQYRDLYKSDEDQSAQTPSGLLKQVRDLFLPDGEELFDPCPKKWDPESWEWNALDPGCEWGRYNFINPPFQNTEKFFDKAISMQDRCASMFLVPCRFHTHFFFRALPHIRKIVILMSGVSFVGYKRPLPVPLCLCVFGPQELLQRCPCMSTHFSTMSFAKLPQDITVPDAATFGAPDTHVINGALSEPLRLLHRHADPTQPLSILMPARLENMVMKDTTLAKKNVKMVFLFPVLKQEKEDKSRLMNGSMFAFYNEAATQHTLKPQWMLEKPFDIMEPRNDHNEMEYNSYLTIPSH
jgi:hypothetical protein